MSTCFAFTHFLLFLMRKPPTKHLVEFLCIFPRALESVKAKELLLVDEYVVKKGKKVCFEAISFHNITTSWRNTADRKITNNVLSFLHGRTEIKDVLMEATYIRKRVVLRIHKIIQRKIIFSAPICFIKRSKLSGETKKPLQDHKNKEFSSLSLHVIKKTTLYNPEAARYFKNFHIPKIRSEPRYVKPSPPFFF